MLKKEKQILDNLNALKSSYFPEVFALKQDKCWKRSYLIMEHVKGDTLTDYLKKNEDVSGAEITDFIYQLCQIIKEIHSSKVCHRDIKPDNIIVTSNKKLKLLDFNISKVWKESREDYKCQTTFITQVSTPMYAAPEVLQGKGYTQSVDIWGIGLIAYLLMGGIIDEKVLKFSDDPIFTSITYQSTIQMYPYATKQVKDFALQCLEADPTRRPTITDEVFTSLLSRSDEFTVGSVSKFS